MPSDLPAPADIVRMSADVARRVADSFRRRGDPQFAAYLELRAAAADDRARHLDDIARVRAAPGGLLEVTLIEAHEAAVRNLEAE